MSYAQFIPPRFIPVTGGGVPRAGAKLYTYQAGTSTLATTYQTSSGTAHANPQVANSAGMFAATYLNPSAGYNYKFVLKDSHGATIWTEDNVPANVFAATDWRYRITDAETSAGLVTADLTFGYDPYDLRRYGGVGDGVTDDTTALTNAIAVVIAGEQSRTPADASQFDYGPALFIAGGLRVLTTGGHDFPRMVRSDGYATIYCSNDAVDVFTGADIYSCYWKGIILEGGKTQVKIDNENRNAGEWIFDDCEFFKSADYAVQALNTSLSWDVTSTNLTFRDCRFRACKQHLKTQCDHTWIIGGWHQPQQALFDDDSAAFYNGGHLHFDCVMLVPFASGSAAPDRRRWIDNYGSVSAFNTRFGGENGGIPIIYHFAPLVEFTETANRVRAGIVFDRCDLFCGQSAVADSSIINCRGEIPPRVSIRDCHGSQDSRAIILVESTANGGIDDIATYISDFETAAGHSATWELRYTYSGNNFYRGTDERLWPEELDVYTKGDQPVIAKLAKIIRTTNQTVPTGTETTITIDTAEYDPWDLYYAAQNAITTPEYSRFARLTGYVETDSHAANSLIYTVHLFKNGNSIADAYVNYLHTVTGAIRVQISGEVAVTYGDLLTLKVRQDSGGDVTLARAALTAEFL